MTAANCRTEPPWLAPLLAPISLGSVKVPNRLFLPGHTTNFASNQRPTDRHVAYLTARVRGGVGLVITEATRVARSSARGNLRLGVFSDDDIEPFSVLPAAIHDAGGLVFSQLVHSGRRAGGHRTLVAGAGPSAVPWSSGAHVPHVLGRSEIASLVDAFAAGARRVLAAGFDGIEVHLGHGHLLQQFLSPFTNRRDDEYGGSLDNRLRFPSQVLSAVSQAAGGAPVGIRVSAHEFLPGGLEPDDVIEIIDRLRQRVDLAFIDVSHSAYQAGYSVSTQIADMTHEPAPFRAFPRAFSSAFPQLPILGVCRIDDLRLAAELVDDGTMSMAGMVRAHIADPELLAKARSEADDEVRSCIACNEGCIGRLELGQPISCVVNTTAGFERAWPAVDRAATAPQRVVVIGGGPAGLSAACEAAERGHDVVLVERAAQLGGAVRTAAQIHKRARLTLLIDDLERRARRAGVEIVVGVEADAAMIASLTPASVVIATGTLPPALGDFGVPTRSIFDVLEDPREFAGGTCVIYDEHGGWPGLGTAWTLAVAGVDVDYVAPVGELGWRIASYSRFGLLHELEATGARLHPLRRIEAGTTGKVAVVSASGKVSHDELRADCVVHIPQPVANTDLRAALEGFVGGPVQVVGDAFAPRGLFEATMEGHAAAVAIGAATAAQDVIYDLLDV